jgi:hypothetical protein
MCYWRAIDTPLPPFIFNFEKVWSKLKLGGQIVTMMQATEPGHGNDPAT